MISSDDEGYDIIEQVPAAVFPNDLILPMILPKSMKITQWIQHEHQDGSPNISTQAEIVCEQEISDVVKGTWILIGQSVELRYLDTHEDLPVFSFDAQCAEDTIKLSRIARESKRPAIAQACLAAWPTDPISNPSSFLF